MSTTYCEHIFRHYVSVWANRPTPQRWGKGPEDELPAGFLVLEFPPTESRQMWTYATCCMSQMEDLAPLELHLFSPEQYRGHVELLTVIAHYHRTRSALGLGHTVNFGRPWMANSSCAFGLISLPYLDGPHLERLHLPDFGVDVSFLWLIPITKAERDYKKVHGLEALEEELEKVSFNYLDPLRQSVV